MRRSRPPYVRFQYIDRELRSNHYPNCTTIACYFDVSYKSIRRDIDFMRDLLHAPIAYDSRRRGYFYSEPWELNPSILLDFQELEALSATTKVLSPYKGTPYYNEICRALEKLINYMPITFSEDEVFDVYSFGNPTVNDYVNDQLFLFLEMAVRNRQKILIKYKTASRQVMTDRVIHPYRLHYHQQGGCWYLIGFCEMRQGVRTFAVGRICNYSVIGDYFVVPDTFSLESYLEKTFDLISSSKKYSIAVRFTSYQSQWIREHHWHSTQMLEEHGDGGVTIRFSVGALEAVKRWVMRYGAQAEVVEPKELRDMVVQELLEMEKMYGKNVQEK